MEYCEKKDNNLGSCYSSVQEIQNLAFDTLKSLHGRSPKNLNHLASPNTKLEVYFICCIDSVFLFLVNSSSKLHLIRWLNLVSRLNPCSIMGIYLLDKVYFWMIYVVSIIRYFVYYIKRKDQDGERDFKGSGDSTKVSLRRNVPQYVWAERR